MSEETTQTKHKFDNKTLTLLTTALVTASNLITNDPIRKVCAASSPCVTIAGAYVFQKCKNFIYLRAEQKRAINAYETIINDLNDKLAKCTDAREKVKIKSKLDKYEGDLHELRIKNIKAFI